MSPARARGSDRFATAGRGTTPAERTAAAHLITRMARDDDDRKQLLAALGLDTSKENT